MDRVFSSSQGKPHYRPLIAAVCPQRKPVDQNDPLILRSCLSPSRLCLHSVVPETNPSVYFLLLSPGLLHIDKEF